MRVICMENMQRGKWLQTSGELKPLNRTALSILEDILQRGQQQADYSGIDPGQRSLDACIAAQTLPKWH